MAHRKLPKTNYSFRLGSRLGLLNYSELTHILRAIMHMDMSLRVSCAIPICNRSVKTSLFTTY